MKNILKGVATAIEYIFYRISKRYNDEVGSGGLFIGVTLYGFFVQPILYLNNIPVLTSIEVSSAVLPSLLCAAIALKQQKRYERLCEKYKYEEIENPFYELFELLIWGVIIGSFILGTYIMHLRPTLLINNHSL